MSLSKKQIISSLFFSICILTQGCTLKENSRIGEASSSMRTPILDGRFLSAQLSWSLNAEEQKHAITLVSENFIFSEKKKWNHPNVISLPVHPPDEVTLELRLADYPQEVKNLSIQAIATTGENLEERSLGIENIETHPDPEGTALRLDLVGLSTLFMDTREQRIYLQIQIKSPNRDVAELGLILSTPPSRVSIVEREFLFEKTSRNESAISPFRNLSSQAQTRELIERIQLRNDSFEKMRLSIPFKTRAKIRMRETRYWAEVMPHSNPHLPQYHQKEELIVKDMDADFFVLPLGESLSVHWTGYSQKNLDALELQPGETLELGLYLEGSVAERLRQFPIQHTALEKRSIDGIPHCQPSQIADLPASGTEGQYCELYAEGTSRWIAFPRDTVDLCRQAMEGMRNCLGSGFRDVALCKQVALWDYELDKRKKQVPNRPIFLPIWMNCRNLPLNPDGLTRRREPAWTWEMIFGNFRVGFETAPVIVEWENEEISMFARFAFSTDSREVEARGLTLIPKKLLLKK